MKEKMELRRLYLNREQYLNASKDIKKEKKNIIQTEVFWMMQMYMEEVMSVKRDLLAMLKKMFYAYIRQGYIRTLCTFLSVLL